MTGPRTAGARLPPVVDLPMVLLLRELVAEVRGLRADLRRRQPGQPDDRHARVLSVLGAIVGTELAFDAMEVLSMPPWTAERAARLALVKGTGIPPADFGLDA